MKHTYINKIFSILLIVFLLTGCLYPKSELTQNKTPNEDQLNLVQQSVENYQENTNGLLPIKTKPHDTPIFEKYLIDFNLLIQKSTLSSIPGNAFENGGIYQYTLVTPEDNPQVKLIDLRITEALRKINVKLDIYRSKHIHPPFGQKVENGIYYIDYKKIGLKTEQYIISPYSKENLPIIMDVHGKIYVDYRIDLRSALEEYDHTYKNGDDIRYILTENFPFAPAYSLPYTIYDDEPVFFTE